MKYFAKEGLNLAQRLKRLPNGLILFLNKLKPEAIIEESMDIPHSLNTIIQVYIL